MSIFIAKVNFMRAELSIVNVILMRAEQCTCEFYKSWALATDENIMRAELCKCEFYEG